MCANGLCAASCSGEGTFTEDKVMFVPLSLDGIAAATELENLIEWGP